MKKIFIFIIILTAVLSTTILSSTIPMRENHLMFLRKEMIVEGEQKTGYIIYADKKAGKYVHTDAAGEGISCVDDTARAGLYFLNMYSNTFDKTSEEAGRYRKLFLETLNFCEAFRTRTGDYYNFVFESGEINRKGITSRASASWWALRELWLLSESINVLDTDAEFDTETVYRKGEQTANLFMSELDNSGLIRGYTDISALYTISLVNLYRYSGENKWLELIRQVSDGIVEKQTDIIFDGIIDEGKEEFNYHSWGSRQVQALSMAYSVTNEDTYLNAARKMADSLYVHQINMGPFYDYTTKNINLFSQIAYGAEAAVTSLYHLYKVSGDEKYALLMALNAGFFFGNNHLNRVMAGETGEGYDGMEKVFINSNAGAESTISYLLTVSLVERLNPETGKFARLKPIHKSEYLLAEAESMDSGLSNCEVVLRNGLEGVTGESFKLKEIYTLNKGAYDVFILGEDFEGSTVKFYMGKSHTEKALNSENDHYIGRVAVTEDGETKVIFSLKSDHTVFLNQILCLPVVEYQVFDDAKKGVNYLVAFNTSDSDAEFEYHPIEGNSYLLSEANFDIIQKDEQLEVQIFKLTSTEISKRFKILNLEEALTNNGIGTTLAPGNLDNFGGKTGAYYPEEKIKTLSENGIIYSEEIPFKIQLDGTDNIITAAQTLEIGEKAKSMYLFGSCDHGSFTGELEIIYSDGESVYPQLSFPDWCESSVKGENVALEVPYRYDSKNLKEWIKPKIYRVKITLNDKTIKSITLPEIPTMHIFGITLEK